MTEPRQPNPERNGDTHVARARNPEDLELADEDVDDVGGGVATTPRDAASGMPSGHRM
jgi:hypothetical protein